MFDGFERRRVRVTETEIDLVIGGSGPPLLLLHGYPQTKAMWHRVAPRLAADFTVVAPDLRGYGASGKPPAGDDHAGYSKRAMARDQVEVMTTLGFERFRLAGHDRGARVAYRLALDHPARVTRLALLDIVPTYEQFSRVDRHAAAGSYHWYFLIQPRGLPERLIGNDPEFFLRYTLDAWCPTPGAFASDAMDEYVRAFKDPAVIHATCEDYRAGATIDFALDEADLQQGRRIACPSLVLWGDNGRPHKRTNVVEIWSRWAVDVRGKGMGCGHFIAEEAPDAALAELRAFFLAR
jgi:haloacetate dehalogenase